MRIRSAILAAGFAATAVVATAGTALADGDAHYYSFSPGNGATAIFASYGESYTISDTKCDGLVGRVQFKVGTGGSVSTYENSLGCNNGDVVVDKSYAEGTVIYFRACTAGGTGGQCDSWVRATA